jgi:hypothetical protein
MHLEYSVRRRSRTKRKRLKNFCDLSREQRRLLRRTPLVPAARIRVPNALNFDDSVRI